jgi:hypothetical protein
VRGLVLARMKTRLCPLELLTVKSPRYLVKLFAEARQLLLQILNF